MKKYIWIFEWIATALLLVLGIVVVVETTILLYTFGILFIIFGLFRLIPLIKTTESKLVKWLIFSETVIALIPGGILLFDAVKGNETGVYIGYIIGGVIYLRGFVHFLSTSLKNEPSNLLNFFFHIILLTIGTIIFVKGGFDKTLLSWIFLGIIVLCAIILGIKGYKDYYNYRGSIVGESKLKELNKEEKSNKKKSETKEAPTSEEIKINILPEEDDKPSIRS